MDFTLQSLERLKTACSFQMALYFSFIKRSNKSTLETGGRKNKGKKNPPVTNYTDTSSSLLVHVFISRPVITVPINFRSCFFH